MKFIGHLDVMRYFQKAFRRANYDSEYTKGFSPHQIMSFAAPLGVGLTSEGEYMDIQLYSTDTPEVMIDRINAVLTEGFKVTSYHFLKEREEHQRAVTAMSLVGSADYMVSLKDGYSLGAELQSKEIFKESFTRFMDQEEIKIIKKSKKSESEVDLKPFITVVAFDAQEYQEKRLQTVRPGTQITAYSEENSVADRYDNGIKIYLQLETGSVVNIKPELVLEAWCEYAGISFEKFAWQVHRTEVYKKEEDGTLIPLDHSER